MSTRHSAHGTPGANVEEEEESLLRRSTYYNNAPSKLPGTPGQSGRTWKLILSIFENVSLVCWLVVGVLIFLCLVVLVLAEGRSRQNPLVTGVETAIAVRKGDTDPRAFQFSVLENGLQVLLVSDPNADKAGAALDVRVGHFDDPEDTPGLSHLLEHMLFLGTKKFPEEDAFDKFLSTKGGMSNAYTSKEDTNYHFEVLPDALEKGLEMFASFFVEPLLNPERIGRERKAVDSENEKNLQNDEWRFTQLLRSTSNPNHPYHKFGTGNHYTLKDKHVKNKTRTSNGTKSLHAALVEHHAKFYSAPQMRLVVLGRADVTQLESLARQYFSEIPSPRHAIPIQKFGYPKVKARTPKQMGLRYDIIPVEDVRMLQMFWLLPPTEKKYRKKTLDYIMNILSGEGVGSIHAALHTEGLVTEVSGGAEDGSSVHNFFGMKLYLTAKGLEKIDHIITVVYAYINMLRQNGPKMSYWLEYKGMAEVDLRFVEKKQAADFVSDLAQNMQIADPGDVVVSDNLWEDWDPSDIKATTNLLTPTNMVVFVAAKSLDLGATPETEKWYGTRYTTRPLSYDSIAEWSRASISSVKEKLAFPVPNEFIPSNFNVKSGLSSAEAAKAVSAKPQTHPHVIQNVQLRYRIWYKQDDTYGVPKVNVLASYHLEHFGIDAVSMVHAGIFADLVKDYLREDLYPATVAGISYNIAATAHGLQIQLIGYNHHMGLCLKRVSNTIHNLILGKVGPGFSDRLELLVDRYDKDLKNWAAEQPYKHAKGYSAFMLRKPYFLPSGLLAALEGGHAITTDSILAFMKNAFRGKCFLQALFHGNIDEQDVALMQGHLLRATENCQLMAPQTKRVRTLPSGETVVRMQESNQDERNSAVVNTYQLGTEEMWGDLEKTCQLKILAAVTSAAVYEQLRTKEQLGYIVFSGPAKVGTILEYVIIVQGVKRSPDTVNVRIESFIAAEYKKLQSLAQEKFKAYVASEISRLRAPYKTLTDESAAYWAEIEDASYMFDRPFKEIEQFDKITVQEVTSMWGDHIMHPQQRNKLSMRVFGNRFPTPHHDTEESMAAVNSNFKLAPEYPPLPQDRADELKMSIETSQLRQPQLKDPEEQSGNVSSAISTKDISSNIGKLNVQKDASRAFRGIVTTTPPHHPVEGAPPKLSPPSPTAMHTTAKKKPTAIEKKSNGINAKTIPAESTHVIGRKEVASHVPKKRSARKLLPKDGARSKEDSGGAKSIQLPSILTGSEH
jgi:insulysin